MFGLFDELRLKSTVFVPGAEATEHPELVRAIAARGHEIAAHGFAHEDYLGKDGETDLLKRTHSVLSDLTGEARGPCLRNACRRRFRGCGDQPSFPGD
jgi:peptidoglycan/xylan/chitin deacetylase (PgdA/CDA1 family)